MSAVIQFPGTIKQSERASTPCRGRVMENKSRGFAALYRSLLDDDWTKDAYLLAAWTRLVLRASASEQTVNYNGQDWNIARGQLVIIPGRFANELRDRNGKPLSRQAVVRMLDWFESRNMIVRAGYDKGTVITICNYDPYQSLVSLVLAGQPNEQQGEHLPEHLNASNGAALQGDAVQPSGQPTEHRSVPEEQPCITTNKDLKIYGAGTADAIPDPVAEQEVIPPEAAIHDRRGKTLRWGTQDDLTCANWLMETRAKSFMAKGLAVPKKPDLAGWSNEIRLMRQHDKRGHREICELFAWVCKTGRELEFCQSPAKLRDKWDSLQLRKANASAVPEKRETQAEKWGSAFKDTSWANDLGDY